MGTIFQPYGEIIDNHNVVELIRVLHHVDTNIALSTIPRNVLAAAISLQKSIEHDMKQMTCAQQNTLIYLGIVAASSSLVYGLSRPELNPLPVSLSSISVAIGVYLRFLPRFMQSRKYHNLCGSSELKQKLNLLHWIKQKFGNMERLHAIAAQWNN